jgi:hypothetical protein
VRRHRNTGRQFQRAVAFDADLNGSHMCRLDRRSPIAKPQLVVPKDPQ